MLPASIPEVVEVLDLPGARAEADRAPDLVVEVAHGATRTADFDAVAARLASPLPEGLVDFFHVNTDAGAPELALAVARRFVEASPSRRAVVLRCRVPRTFVDCNRRLEASADAFREGRVTPGLMPWVVEPADRALLGARHRAYLDVVEAVAARALPAGLMLLLHTYAPRTVDVEVDDRIVENLRRAYRPEIEPTWPLRPPLDLIHRTLDGRSLAPAGLLERLREGLGGLEVADGATYPMHPSTAAFAHAERWPGRVACLEVRRDLLAEPFEPFREMRIGAAKVEGLAGPLAAALAAVS